MRFWSSKSIRNILVVSAVVSMVLLSGCEKKQVRVNSLDTTQPGQQSAQPTRPDGQRNNPGSLFGNANGTFSIIMEIKGSALTVATMPADASPQSVNQPTRPSGNLPQGSMPQGSMPQGSMPQGSMPNVPFSPNANGLDTANWPKTTWTVDDKTTIVQGQIGGSGTATTNALKLADLKVGDNIMITERAGQANVADQITVIQGMGNFPGGGRVPVTTTKS